MNPEVEEVSQRFFEALSQFEKSVYLFGSFPQGAEFEDIDAAVYLSNPY